MSTAIALYSNLFAAETRHKINVNLLALQSVFRPASFQFHEVCLNRESIISVDFEGVEVFQYRLIEGYNAKKYSPLWFIHKLFKAQ